MNTVYCLYLTFSTLDKFSDDILKYFPQRLGFDISGKLSPTERICQKCQILFPVRNKKNIINLSSAELAKGVVKVNLYSAFKN